MRMTLRGCLFLLIPALLAPGALAADPVLEAGPGAAVARLVLAQDLYALGQAQGDALTLLAAARLAASVGLDEGGAMETTGIAAPGDAPLPPTAPEILAAAQARAGADPALLELIAGVGPATEDSPALRAWAGELAAGQSGSYRFALPGGPAALAVLGNGAANLDLTVTDSEGSVLCSEMGPSDRILCSFATGGEGTLTLTLFNRGDLANGYRLVMP